MPQNILQSAIISAMPHEKASFMQSRYYVRKYETNHETYGTITNYVYYSAQRGHVLYEFSREHLMTIQGKVITARVDKLVAHHPLYTSVNNLVVRVAAHTNRPVDAHEVNWEIMQYNRFASYDNNPKFSYILIDNNKEQFVLDLENKMSRKRALTKELQSINVNFKQINPLRLYEESLD